jgi:hypothetical protein
MILQDKNGTELLPQVSIGKPSLYESKIIRGMKGVLLTFDLSNHDSFTRLGQWLDDVGR